MGEVRGIFFLFLSEIKKSCLDILEFLEFRQAETLNVANLILTLQMDKTFSFRRKSEVMTLRISFKLNNIFEDIVSHAT